MFRKEIQASFVPGKIKGLCSNHRVIILNRGRTEETDANFPDQNVQLHSVTSIETARSLANGPSWGRGGCWGREVCILRSPGIAASPIFLLSMGGVCGRSLTAGKILFTGRQTCSLYLVLWLCGTYAVSVIYHKKCFVMTLWHLHTKRKHMDNNRSEECRIVLTL